MSDYNLSLVVRTATGKHVPALRAQGFVPSVIYGGKSEVLAQSAYNETEKVLRLAGYHSPIDLTIDGKKTPFLVALSLFLSKKFPPRKPSKLRHLSPSKILIFPTHQKPISLSTKSSRRSTSKPSHPTCQRSLSLTAQSLLPPKTSFLSKTFRCQRVSSLPIKS